MFGENELKSVTKLCGRECVVRVETVEKRHVVDGDEWLVRMESHAFIEPNTSLRSGGWC